MLICMTIKSHWESIYRTKSADALSWYASHLNASLQYIGRAAAAPDAAIIDVGGGESTLVDDLLAAGYAQLMVLDISATALDATRRLACGRRRALARRGRARGRAAAAAFDIWHDRAVFHFLTRNAQRQRYVEQVLHALKPGGFAIVGSFDPQGRTSAAVAGVALFGRRAASQLRRAVPAARQPCRAAHHALGQPAAVRLLLLPAGGFLTPSPRRAPVRFRAARRRAGAMHWRSPRPNSGSSPARRSSATAASR
jgi:SAM-dependent methyltransferase